MTVFRLLVVEDDPELRSLLLRGLGEEGFEVQAVGDAASAMAHVEEVPDGLVIDVGLPDADGRDLCQALRARGVEAPVLFLTARDAVTDRLAGFSAGGDDYVTKPFHFDEVVARLRALLRRSRADASTTVGELRLDPVAHSISGDDGEGVADPDGVQAAGRARRAAGRGGAPARARGARRGPGAIVHDNTLDQYVAPAAKAARGLGPGRHRHGPRRGYRLGEGAFARCAGA